MSTPILSPYVGLQPFTVEEADYFFGRERDQRVISSNLKASRLTVLYGPTGVGKSSVLQAGVVYQLRKENPKAAVVYFSRWQGPGFLEAFKVACIEEARRVNPALEADPAMELGALLEALARGLKRPVWILLDQFEEYLLYHPEGESAGTVFEQELASAVNSDDLDFGLIISLREDALSELDRFKLRIPNVLGNMLRLDAMKPEAAKNAICRPLEVFNSRHRPDKPIRMENELVDAVLEGVRSRREQFGAGEKANEVKGRSEQVETASLQLVMTRLWEEETKRGGDELRRRTLDALGGVKDIVGTHLDRVMEKLTTGQRDACARMFRQLVTPSGGKYAYSPGDLASYAECPVPEVRELLRTLVKERVLRPLSQPERYEILHDVLAPAILSWRSRYLQKLVVAEETAKARRRSRIFLGLLAASIAVLIGVVLLGVYVFRQKEKAESAARLARATTAKIVSLRLQAAAKASLFEDQRALRYALQAYRTLESVGLPLEGEAQKTLREALSYIPVEERYVFTSAIDSARHRIALASSDIQVLDIQTGKKLASVAQPRLGPSSRYFRVSAFTFGGDAFAAISNDGHALSWSLDSDAVTVAALAGDHRTTTDYVFTSDLGLVSARDYMTGTIRIWDVRTGRVVRRMEVPKGADARISPDGTRVAVLVMGALSLWSVSENKLLFTSALEPGCSYATGLTFSHDGARVGVYCSGAVMRFELSSRTMTLHRISDEDALASWRTLKVLFSPSLDRVLLIHREGSARVVEVDTGKPIWSERFLGLDLDADYLGDEGFLLERGDLGNVFVWLQPVGNPVDTAARRLERPQLFADEYLLALGEIEPSLDLGIRRAKEGDLQGAQKAFDEATKLPGIQFEPASEARRIGAMSWLARAVNHAEKGEPDLAQDAWGKASAILNPETLSLVSGSKVPEKAQLLVQAWRTRADNYLKEGKFGEVTEAALEAEKLDPKAVSGSSWDQFCWQGSLKGHAAQVLPACEKAVQLTPDSAKFRDSRGLARALTNDRAGAIQDFEFYIQNRSKNDDGGSPRVRELVGWRKNWVKQLRAGKNPFTPEVLKSLQ